VCTDKVKTNGAIPPADYCKLLYISEFQMSKDTTCILDLRMLEFQMSKDSI